MQAPSAAFECLIWLSFSQFIVQKNVPVFKYMQCEAKHTVVTTLSHASQLLLFIWMIVSDGNSKKDLLQTLPLHWKTRNEDIFQNTYVSFVEV
jgi:hypothetical protein